MCSKMGFSPRQRHLTWHCLKMLWEQVLAVIPISLLQVSSAAIHRATTSQSCIASPPASPPAVLPADPSAYNLLPASHQRRRAASHGAVPRNHRADGLPGRAAHRCDGAPRRPTRAARRLLRTSSSLLSPAARLLQPMAEMLGTELPRKLPLVFVLMVAGRPSGDFGYVRRARHRRAPAAGAAGRPRAGAVSVLRHELAGKETRGRGKGSRTAAAHSPRFRRRLHLLNAPRLRASLFRRADSVDNGLPSSVCR
jgi:hypothetical protein